MMTTNVGAEDETATGISTDTATRHLEGEGTMSTRR